MPQGHYCPAVAHRVYKATELGQGPPIKLKGVAIGNGMTNPAVQFPAYADFALQNNLISQSVSGEGEALYWVGWEQCNNTLLVGGAAQTRLPKQCTNFFGYHLGEKLGWTPVPWQSPLHSPTNMQAAESFICMCHCSNTWCCAQQL